MPATASAGETIGGVFMATSMVAHPVDRETRRPTRTLGAARPVRPGPMARRHPTCPADDGKDSFFPRGALEGGLDFDRLVGGEKVDFEVEASPKGPRAVKVRAA